MSPSASTPHALTNRAGFDCVRVTAPWPRHLHLDGNQISDVGAAALCEALRSNTALRRCTLYLTANPLSRDGKSACRVAASKPPSFNLSLL